MSQPVTAEQGQDRSVLRIYEHFGVSFGHVNGQPNVTADACPFCGRNKFGVNRQKGGVYNCFHCNQKGGPYDFLTYMHEQLIEQTETADYSRLKKARKNIISVQLLKSQRLAYDATRKLWYVPFMHADGKRVVNFQTYDTATGEKKLMPGLPAALFGLDQLSSDLKRTLFLCEGPWDAMALDAQMRKAKTRERYDVLAVPGCTIFKEEWAEFFKNRKVRLLYDNDQAGRDGQERVAKMLEEATPDIRVLNWPEGLPDKCDISDLIVDNPKNSIVTFSNANCEKVVIRPKLGWLTYDDVKDEADRVEWMIKDRVPFGCFVSLSGKGGTSKSTVARYLAALVTAGLPMPYSNPAQGPFTVLYFTSEDSPKRVYESVKLMGGDVSRLRVHGVMLPDGVTQLNIFEHMLEIKKMIRDSGAKLVVIDALNSFCGDAKILTDMAARVGVSNRLNELAQSTGVTLLGIRNTADDGTRTLGAQSMSDISRCIIESVRTSKPDEPEQLELVWKKVSDTAAKHYRTPWVFSPKDLSEGLEGREHWRTIVWQPRVKVEKKSGGKPTKMQSKIRQKKG